MLNERSVKPIGGKRLIVFNSSGFVATALRNFTRCFIMYLEQRFIMKIKIHNKLLTWQILAIIIIDGLFFGYVNPNKVNSLFLIVGFVLIAITLYLLMKLFLIFFVKLGFKVRNRRKIALFVSLLLSLLLSLQSIGQLTIRDVVIIVPISTLLYIYAAYIRPRTLV